MRERELLAGAGYTETEAESDADVDMDADIRILTLCSLDESDPGHAPPQRSAGLPRGRRNGSAVLLPETGC